MCAVCVFVCVCVSAVSESVSVCAASVSVVNARVRRRASVRAEYVGACRVRVCAALVMLLLPLNLF